MSRISSQHQHGGIVVETAIILAVIILLVLISIPAYRGGPEDARVAQAENDILTLSQAQQRVGDSLGYYVPLQLLDNIDLQSEAEGIVLVPTDISDAGGSIEVMELAAATGLEEKWNGPYAQTKRIHLGEAGKEMDLSLINEQSRLRDYPLDPWGQPYRFYSPAGIVGSRAAEISQEAIDSNGFSDGAITDTDDRFETYAVVSYGPNGESDTVTEQNDDIIYLFEVQGAEQP